MRNYIAILSIVLAFALSTACKSETKTQDVQSNTSEKEITLWADTIDIRHIRNLAKSPLKDGEIHFDGQLLDSRFEAVSFLGQTLLHNTTLDYTYYEETTGDSTWIYINLYYNSKGELLNHFNEGALYPAKELTTNKTKEGYYLADGDDVICTFDFKKKEVVDTFYNLNEDDFISWTQDEEIDDLYEIIEAGDEEYVEHKKDIRKLLKKHFAGFYPYVHQHKDYLPWAEFKKAHLEDSKQASNKRKSHKTAKTEYRNLNNNLFYSYMATVIQDSTKFDKQYIGEKKRMVIPSKKVYFNMYNMHIPVAEDFKYTPQYVTHNDPQGKKNDKVQLVETKHESSINILQSLQSSIHGGMARDHVYHYQLLYDGKVLNIQSPTKLELYSVDEEEDHYVLIINVEGLRFYRLMK